MLAACSCKEYYQTFNTYNPKNPANCVYIRKVDKKSCQTPRNPVQYYILFSNKLLLLKLVIAGTYNMHWNSWWLIRFLTHCICIWLLSFFACWLLWRLVQKKYQFKNVTRTTLSITQDWTCFLRRRNAFWPKQKKRPKMVVFFI